MNPLVLFVALFCFFLLLSAFFAASETALVALGRIELQNMRERKVRGVETIERLRSIDPEVKAIICSGYSDEAALSEFLSYGFRGALPKPFTRRELSDALQKAFNGS